MRNRGRVSFSITIVIAILLVPLLFTIPVKACPLTVVTLSLQEKPPKVDVSPGSSGIVTVAGEVTCLKYGLDQVKVYLQAQSDVGECNVNPPSFVFSGPSGSQETDIFSVTTKVPQGYSSSATPAITVSGYWVQGGLQYNIPPVSQIIIIMQYYEFDVSVTDTVVQAESGENVNLFFNVFNEGNGDDTFSIDLDNRDNMKSQGFELPKPMEVKISEDGSKNISYEVGIPENISGVHSLDFCITSKGSEAIAFICRYKMTITLNIVPKSKEDLENEENPLDFMSDELIGFPIYLIVIFVIIFYLIIFLVIKRWRGGATSTENQLYV